MSIKTEAKISVLSFYSGGGFMDMGFEMAGFDIRWTNEFDACFAGLHAAGITSWREAEGDGRKAEIFNTRSIRDIETKDIVKEAFPGGLPEDFGMIGGPPCQDFSLNGKQTGFKGERGKLTILYFDKIMELKPSFFVMENVTGLIKGKSSRVYLAQLLKRVEEDYIVDHHILNALDFGVPQSRERVFFIGFRKDKMKNVEVKPLLSGRWFPWPGNQDGQRAEIRYNWPGPVAFGSTPLRPEGIPEDLFVERCLVPEEGMDLVANAREYFNLKTKQDKLEGIKEGETNRPSFKRLHRYKYSPTACYGNNEVHLHPFLQRRLSVRETLRIQGVPDSYVLPAALPLSKKFKMIGNGVPVPMAKALAGAIQTYIFVNKLIKHGYLDKGEAQPGNVQDQVTEHQT